jgi:hypothetical protein
MIAVLDALMPESAVVAALRFESGFSFNLDLTRMRLVTDDLLASVATESDESSSWDSGNDGYSSGEESSSDEPASEEPGEDSVTSEEETAGSEDGGETASAAVPSAPITKIDLGPAPSFTASTRQQASLLLSAVEGFFRVVEPSSPVTVLLARARSYFGKDFASILNELMPPPSTE